MRWLRAAACVMVVGVVASACSTPDGAMTSEPTGATSSASTSDNSAWPYAKPQVSSDGPEFETLPGITAEDIKLTTYPVTVEKGVVLHSAATEEGVVDLRADVYIPQSDTVDDWPVVLYSHGGGFLMGERDIPAIAEFCRYLAERGIVVYSTDYRLGPSKPKLVQDEFPALFPRDPLTDTHLGVLPRNGFFAALEDTPQNAIGALAGKHSTSNRVVLAGDSAGAMASAYTAYVTSKTNIAVPDIAAVVSLWGAMPFTRDDEFVINHHDVPAFVVQGDADVVVPVDESRRMVAALRSAGTTHYYVERKGAGHDFGGFDMYASVGGKPPVADQVAAFIHKFG